MSGICVLCSIPWERLPDWWWHSSLLSARLPPALRPQHRARLRCRSLLAERFSHCSSCPARSPELKQCVITHILELDPVNAKIPPREQLQHGEDHAECFPLDLTAIKMSLILNHDTLWRIYKWDDTGLRPEALNFALKLSRVGNRVEQTPSWKRARINYRAVRHFTSLKQLFGCLCRQKKHGTNISADYGDSTEHSNIHLIAGKICWKLVQLTQ